MSDELRAKLDASKKKTDEGFFADLAGPLRFIGYFFFFFAAVVLAMALANVIWYDQEFGVGVGITLIILTSIGLGFRRAAKFVASGKEPDIAMLGFWAFVGFGTVMVLVGILIAFDDPGGLFACAFGAVFIGAGFLLRKLMRAPEGMKAVTVSGSAVSVSSAVAGIRGARTRTVSIYVDESATDEEVELARTRWATKHWMARPDWVSGEVLDEKTRNRTSSFIAAVVSIILASISLAVALMYGDFWWFVTLVLGIIAVVTICLAVHDSLHRRKFADSVLVLEQTPLRLGGELRAELRSGVPPHLKGATPFKVTLACVHRWERTSGSGKNSRTTLESKTLWQQQHEAKARTELTTHQCVPIIMHIPEDQPETSLGASREGNFWRMHVHLPLPGLDYRANFVLPVLKQETRIDPAYIEEETPVQT